MVTEMHVTRYVPENDLARRVAERLIEMQMAFGETFEVAGAEKIAHFEAQGRVGVDGEDTVRWTSDGIYHAHLIVAPARFDFANMLTNMDVYPAEMWIDEDTLVRWRIPANPYTRGQTLENYASYTPVLSEPTK